MGLVCLFVVLTASASLRGAKALPEYSELCGPSSVSCDTSPTIKSGTRNAHGSCCQKCSCALDCNVVGTCCPGVDHLMLMNYQNITPQYACVSPQNLLNSPRNMSFTNYQIGMGDLTFRIVDRCPDRKTSIHFPKCENPETLHDYVMVSDIANDFVFRNKHCAACHGVDNVIDWTLSTSCTELMMMSFKTVEDRNDYILNYCDLSIQPPEYVDTEISRCYNDIHNIISKCNTTGNWDVYDRTIEDACLKERPTKNTIFKGEKPLIGTYKKYANVYCYLCNIGKNQLQLVREKMCEVEKSTTKRGMSIKFSAILDLRKQPSYNNEVKRDSCSSTHVWDPFTNVCRQLLCPIGTMPINSKCEDFVISTSGFGLVFYIAMNVHSGNFEQLLQGFHSLGKHIVTSLINKECGLCEIRLLPLNNTSTSIFEMRTNIYTTQNCSTVLALQKIKALLLTGTRNIRFRYLSNIFNVSLSITTERLSLPVDGDEKRYHYKECSDSVQIQPYHLQNCPRFTIFKDDFINVGFHNFISEKSADLSIWTKDGDSIVSICAMKYFQIWRSVNEAFVVKMTPIIASFLGVFLFVF